MDQATPSEIDHSSRREHEGYSSPIKPVRKQKVPQPKPIAPVILGESDSTSIGEGDSRIIYNAFAADDAFDDGFQKLKNEVNWQVMRHAEGEVPRLVSCQGEINDEDESMPLYRHPSDRSIRLEQFSPVVRKVQGKVEDVVGHKMNHVLIQLYRSGDDHISEHSDKTLDIVRGSVIVNASFGAQRTMRLRTKKTHADHANGGRLTQLVPMPHASVFILGPETNMRWLHGIKWDRRPPNERKEEEIAFGGERISLTFRNIGTFLDANEEHIWGQGAKGKTRQDAEPVVNGNREESKRLIDAFGFENQASDFDWGAVYGGGFNVLHQTNVENTPGVDAVQSASTPD